MAALCARAAHRKPLDGYPILGGARHAMPLTAQRATTLVSRPPLQRARPCPWTCQGSRGARRWLPQPPRATQVAALGASRHQVRARTDPPIARGHACVLDTVLHGSSLRDLTARNLAVILMGVCWSIEKGIFASGSRIVPSALSRTACLAPASSGEVGRPPPAAQGCPYLLAAKMLRFGGVVSRQRWQQRPRGAMGVPQPIYKYLCAGSWRVKRENGG